jgi:hypothetical protein
MSTVSVRLNSTSFDYIDVYWETSFSLDTSYVVKRGEAYAGPFDAVSEPMYDRFHIRDYFAPSLRSWRTLYYVIESTDSSGGVSVSDPVSLRARPPLDALEMIRLNSLLFKEYVGRPCLVYSRRTFGEHCRLCYDEVTHLQLTKNCNTCFGTGFARGYHFPIYSYIQVSPEQRQLTPAEPMISAQASTQARMSVYPLVKPGDLLVEQEGTRWRLQSVSYTERLRSPVQQMLTIFRIPEGDIEHTIPVQWREDVKTSPRSFSPRSDL